MFPDSSIWFKVLILLPSTDYRSSSFAAPVAASIADRGTIV